MNTIATIEPRTRRTAFDHQLSTNSYKSKEFALASAVKIIAGDLRSYLANLDILIEVAEAYRICRSLARRRPERRDTQSLMHRIDQMVVSGRSAHPANWRPSGVSVVSDGSPQRSRPCPEIEPTFGRQSCRGAPQ
jgi:hypothetical protein